MEYEGGRERRVKVEDAKKRQSRRRKRGERDLHAAVSFVP